MIIKTGIKNFETVINGGLPKNTRVLLSGGPGSGKTLFALRVLMEGAKNGEKCCLVSLNETKDEILRACEGIKSLRDAKKYVGKNLAIEHIPLGENITIKKFLDILSSYPKIDRLAIDNVNKLLIFSNDKRSYRLYLSELVKHLRPMGITLLLCETKEDEIDTGNGEAFECDGIIHITFLDLEEKPMRTLAVTKMRYTNFEPRVLHELVIDNNDIFIGQAKII